MAHSQHNAGSSVTRPERSPHLDPDAYIWGALGLVAIALVFSGVPASAESGSVSSRFWPLLAASLMTAAGLALFLTTLKGSRKKNASGGSGEEVPSADSESANSSEEAIRPRNHLILALLLVIYVVILPLVGYVVATVLVTCALGLVIGIRKFWVSIVVAAFYTTVTTLIFGVLMNMALPRGRGVFTEISSALF